MLFCQNDSPMRGSFWHKDSLITHIFFELLSIMIFSPVANFGHHPLSTLKKKTIKNDDVFKKISPTNCVVHSAFPEKEK